MLTCYLLLASNKEPKLRDLFDVRYKSTPKIVVLHKGHTYKYTGAIRDQEAIVDFAIEQFQDSIHRF